MWVVKDEADLSCIPNVRWVDPDDDTLAGYNRLRSAAGADDPHPAAWSDPTRMFPATRPGLSEIAPTTRTVPLNNGRNLRCKPRQPGMGA